MVVYVVIHPAYSFGIIKVPVKVYKSFKKAVEDNGGVYYEDKAPYAHKLEDGKQVFTCEIED